MYTLENKVQLIGFVFSKPDVQTTESGIKCARLSIATHEVYRNAKGEKVKETQHHHLVGWGKVAELCELFLKPGTQVIIEGKLLTFWHQVPDGLKACRSEVLIHEILVLPNKQG